MMIPAGAGWEPEAAATSGVLEEEPLMVMDSSALLLPLIGLAAIVGAAYVMESARGAGDDVDVEIDEDDEDDLDEDDDLDDIDFDDEDDEDED